MREVGHVTWIPLQGADPGFHLGGGGGGAGGGGAKNYMHERTLRVRNPKSLSAGCFRPRFRALEALEVFSMLSSAI